MKCTEIFRWQSRQWRECEVINPPEPRFELQLFAEGDKTEQPTEKKRRDARKKGQVARSQELNAAAVLLMGFFMLRLLWEYIYGNLAEYMTYIYSNLYQSTSTESITQLFIGIMLLIAKTSLPVMLAIMFMGLGINLLQVGLVISTEKLEPKLDNLNPVNGFGRIFSKRSLVELIKSIFKIIIIGFFIWLYVKEQIPYMPYFIYLDLATSLAQIADIIFTLAFQIIGVIIVLAIADYAYQSWQTTQDLMMTKQEVKDDRRSKARFGKSNGKWQ